ncbi:hypothetical protein [Rossellomorea aquimaris]|uniref:hypothetical protein n=1 Tax=Rossellomorea aquimaris TaxID=189382 RepID=UPI0007D0B842|nr:hypothetical protein [Rossellomorea aquimaris]
MPNWLPFIILVATSIILFVYTLTMKRQISSYIILFWLFISGLAYLFEYIVFILFNSYAYHPHLLENKYNDSVFGSISSQAFSVPIAITIIVVYKLKIKWTLLIIGLFYLIEACFMFLDIYTQYWWKSLYTSLFLIFSIFLAKIWWWLLETRSNRLLYFLTLFFALSTITLSLGWILSPLLKWYEIPLNVFSNEMRDIIAGNSLYLWFANLFYSLVITFKNKVISFYFFTIATLFILELFMQSVGILTFKSPLLMLVFPLFHLCMIGIGTTLYNKSLTEKKKGLF